VLQISVSTTRLELCPAQWVTLYDIYTCLNSLYSERCGFLSSGRYDFSCMHVKPRAARLLISETK